MRSARQIATLTDQINMYIASKEAPLTLENLDLKDALLNIKNEFSQRLRLRDIKWSEPDNLPFIRADRVSLDRGLQEPRGQQPEIRRRRS
jgi:light-regulated signal transduction histidine kinase (bacteriophytochrome)